MTGLGKALILLGALLLVIGGAILFIDRMNILLGGLPGDITWRGRGWTVSFPFVTCVVLSVVLSLLLWVVERLRR